MIYSKINIIIMSMDFNIGSQSKYLLKKYILNKNQNEIL